MINLIFFEMNFKNDNFLLKKYSFVNITFEFSLTVKKEYRTFYLQTNLENVNGYTILRLIFSKYLFNKNYTFEILNTYQTIRKINFT